MALLIPRKWRPLSASLGLAATILVLVALNPADAPAAFPGTNGLIAFDTVRDGNNEIYSMTPDGSNQTRLTNNLLFDGEPAWSPDGTKIAFTRDGPSDIWVMNADGTNQVQLTTDGATDQEPAWSPDGTMIAFASARSGNFDIWTMNADGSNEAPVTTDPGADSGPAWSPDGTRIAFRSTRNGGGRIWAMNADGTTPVQVSSIDQGDENAAWSPDGTKITFDIDDGQSVDVFVVNSSGPLGSDQPLTDNVTSQFSNVEAAWSPNGAQIAFTSDDVPGAGPPLFNPPGPDQIWLMNADGSNEAPLPTTAEGNNADWQRIPDTSPPDTIIDSGPTGTIATDQASFSFHGDPAADTAKLQCKLDAGPFSDCTSPSTFSGLTDGSHSVSFRAEDAAGNQDPTPASGTFAVDTSSPSITIAVADGKLKLNKKGKPGELNLNPRGKGILVLTCSPAEASPPCSGKVKLTTAEKIATKTGAKKKVALAKFDFSIGAGEKKRFRVQLKKAILKLVEDEPAARDADLAATVSDAVGNTAKINANVTLAPA